MMLGGRERGREEAERERERKEGEELFQDRASESGNYSLTPPPLDTPPLLALPTDRACAQRQTEPPKLGLFDMLLSETTKQAAEREHNSDKHATGHSNSSYIQQ